MPQLEVPKVPTHRTVEIVGRVGGGALDPETGVRANGGVCFYDSGREVRCEPGDVVEAPVKVAYGLIADGLALDPNATTDDADTDDAEESD